MPPTGSTRKRPVGNVHPVHESPSTAFPSSQSSVPTLRWPSPQRFSVQSLRQPSSSLLFPSSHGSVSSLTPSPQRTGRHPASAVHRQGPASAPGPVQRPPHAVCCASQHV